MNAAELARALGGRKAGDGWTARCPAHDDRTPSFSIRDGDDGKLLVYCFVCSSEQVIGALRHRGLWPTSDRRDGDIIRRQAHRANSNQRGREDRERTAVASCIWQSATPAHGTLVEIYLQARGISIAPPPMLRFHGALKHPSGSFWPTMVALVTRGTDETPVAIHRTFIARDGVGKAPVDPEKMMLGPCRGGAVRLAAPGEVLMVGEGIETSLSAMQATGYPAWAALSTSGLRSLDLPSGLRDIIILADGDEPGEAAAREAALRWKCEGRRVRIARPPQGLDFNGVLRGEAPPSSAPASSVPSSPASASSAPARPSAASSSASRSLAPPSWTPPPPPSSAPSSAPSPLGSSAPTACKERL